MRSTRLGEKETITHLCPDIDESHLTDYRLQISNIQGNIVSPDRAKSGLTMEGGVCGGERADLRDLYIPPALSRPSASKSLTRPGNEVQDEQANCLGLDGYIRMSIQQTTKRCHFHTLQHICLEKAHA